MRRTTPLFAMALLLGALVCGSAQAATGKAAVPATPPQAEGMQAEAVPTTGPTLLGYGDEDIWDESGQLIKKNVGGKGSTPGDMAAQTPDPLEDWNRMWFGFNDKMYFWVLKPVTQGYSAAVPERPRMWVRNFFHNLMYPVRFTSLMLQGKFDAAGVETSRFITNTAFGLGGLGDMAGGLKTARPIPSTEQDLGLTFGYWGADNGMYLVWPFIGPSSGRDTLGYAGDYFLTPMTYIHPWYWSMASKGYQRINDISFRIGDYEAVKDASLDPYEAVRDGYLRMRYKKMND